jgi:hypothetical protein
VILQVVDANGVTQAIVAQAPATPTDRSGTILATGVSQVLMDPPAAGVTRAGWLVQNKSTTGNTMQINDLGNPADASPSSVDLAPGASFPPPGYPVTQGEITITGNIGDNFMAREW